MSSVDDEIELELERMRRTHTQAKLNKEQVTNERDEYNKTELDKKANIAQLDTKTFNIKRETRDIEREKEGLTEQLEQFEENVKVSSSSTICSFVLAHCQYQCRIRTHHGVPSSRLYASLACPAMRW